MHATVPHTYNYNWFSISFFFYRLHRNKRRERSFILRKTFSISQLFKKKIIRRTITYLLCSIIILNIHFTNYIDRGSGIGDKDKARVGGAGEGRGVGQKCKQTQSQ